MKGFKTDFRPLLAHLHDQHGNSCYMSLGTRPVLTSDLYVRKQKVKGLKIKGWIKLLTRIFLSGLKPKLLLICSCQRTTLNFHLDATPGTIDWDKLDEEDSHCDGVHLAEGGYSHCDWQLSRECYIEEILTAAATGLVWALRTVSDTPVRTDQIWTWTKIRFWITRAKKPNIPRRPLHHKWHRMHPDWMRVDTSRNQHGNLHLRPIHCKVRIFQNFPPTFHQPGKQLLHLSGDPLPLSDHPWGEQ